METLADSAVSLINPEINYDPRYFSIGYPNGDVPAHLGVCTDVIIRAYRKLEIDLQVKVHEDMAQHFNEYPNHWGLAATDKNIDHRRVPNLMRFFTRAGAACAANQQDQDYLPGDIVCWDLGRGLTHIGLVMHETDPKSGRHLVLHNIGGGQVLQDILLDYRIIGHFRYIPY
ncbi:MAG: DUF1287 domain-containing protein [Owenweeksia sp.]|nr:DUF1287 domain-containing protein [Owenweeksia sp.]